jgi:hypothetical protein
LSFVAFTQPNKVANIIESNAVLTSFIKTFGFKIAVGKKKNGYIM